MISDVELIKTTVLSDNWYVLRKHTYRFKNAHGEWVTQEREAYDRGNGATILLYNLAQRTVVLTRQFRLPTYVNGNPDGMLIEAPAGLLDQDNAETCIRRETQEETGYLIDQPVKLFQVYMSPGSVTETVHFFAATYTSAMKVAEGGGLEEEQENIEVLELDFDEAYQMIATGGIKDAKTIILLQYAKLHLGF